MRLILIALLAFGVIGCEADEPTKVSGRDRSISRRMSCEGKPKIIAVIDTGFGKGVDDYTIPPTVMLCKFGHKTFVKNDITYERREVVDGVPFDHHGHGTNIAGIIDTYLREKRINFCLVILKYYDPMLRENDNIGNTISAINYATAIHADYINYSSGGTEFNQDEADAVKKFLDSGGKFIAAAGNEHSDLAKNPYYPAMDDDRVVVVGNIDTSNGKKVTSSNYGTRVNRWENGDATVYGLHMMGTSQSAALATGKLVSETKNFCK